MKKTLSIFLTLLLLLTLLPGGTLAAEETAALSARGLRVDGKLVRCEVYEIGGEAWFRLRDVALALNRTGSRFSVGWDAGTRTVLLTTGEAYVSDGSEESPRGDLSATAVPAGQTVCIDGEEVTGLPAWNVGGNNYFRLADLAPVLGFQADYNEENATAIIRAKVSFARAGQTRFYTDEISGNMVSCMVIEVNDPTPWLVRESVVQSNDGLYYRETTAYGEDGRILSVVTDGDGFTSTLAISYDELGRETERVTETCFDTGGESRSVQVSEYDIWGQLVRLVADDGSSVTTFTYDDRGNQTSFERAMESPVGEWIDRQYMEYDEQGNLTATRSEHNGEITGSSRTTYEDGGNVVRTEQFDAMGNRISAIERVFADGKLVRMTQDNGAYAVVSTASYDETGTVTVTESPTGRTTYWADKDGNAQRQEWTDGVRSSLTVWNYDEEGRLVRIGTGDPTEAPAQVTEIVYDGGGRPLSNVYTFGGYREEDVFAYDLEAMKLTHTKTTTYPEATELALSSDSMTLPVGGMNILMASFLPGNARRGAVAWSSSDESVATVDGRGIVTAVGPGEAAVTAESEGGLTAECRVTVTEE
jgi:hypothetical protein